MAGEMTALIAAISFGLSYMYTNRAQIKGETSDNGLLPLLTISTIVLILACVVRVLGHPTEFHPEPGWGTPILYCILAGISWNFLSRMTLLASIVRIGATRGIVIKSVAPMMTVAMAVLFVHEQMHIGDKVGFLLMVVSIALLVLERSFLTKSKNDKPESTDDCVPSSTVNPTSDSTSEGPMFISPKSIWPGILLGLLAALLQSIGHLFRKLGMGVVPPLFGSTLDMTAATLAYILYLLGSGTLVQHIKFYLRVRSVDILAASILATLGVVTTFVAIAVEPISTVAMILGTQPIFMPLLSALFFPGLEKFTWVSYLAAVLVAAGVASIVIYG